MHTYNQIVNQDRSGAAPSILTTAKGRLWAILGTVGAVVGAAVAQTSTSGGDGLDYSGAIDGFKESMTTFFSTNGAKIMAVLVIMLAFGLVWRLVKRAAKSV